MGSGKYLPVWRDRWVVLSGLRVRYYCVEERGRGRVGPVRGEGDVADASPDPAAAFGVRVTLADGAVWYLGAPSAAERSRWLRVLHDALAAQLQARLRARVAGKLRDSQRAPATDADAAQQWAAVHGTARKAPVAGSVRLRPAFEEGTSGAAGSDAAAGAFASATAPAASSARSSLLCDLWRATTEDAPPRDVLQRMIAAFDARSPSSLFEEWASHSAACPGSSAIDSNDRHSLQRLCQWATRLGVGVIQPEARSASAAPVGRAVSSATIDIATRAVPEPSVHLSTMEVSARCLAAAACTTGSLLATLSLVVAMLGMHGGDMRTLMWSRVVEGTTPREGAAGTDVAGEVLPSDELRARVGVLIAHMRATSVVSARERSRLRGGSRQYVPCELRFNADEARLQGFEVDDDGRTLTATAEQGGFAWGRATESLPVDGDDCHVVWDLHVSRRVGGSVSAPRRPCRLSLAPSLTAASRVDVCPALGRRDV